MDVLIWLTASHQFINVVKLPFIWGALESSTLWDIFVEDSDALYISKIETSHVSVFSIYGAWLNEEFHSRVTHVTPAIHKHTCTVRAANSSVTRTVCPATATRPQASLVPYVRQRRRGIRRRIFGVTHAQSASAKWRFSMRHFSQSCRLDWTLFSLSWNLSVVSSQVLCLKNRRGRGKKKNTFPDFSSSEAAKKWWGEIFSLCRKLVGSKVWK